MEELSPETVSLTLDVGLNLPRLEQKALEVRESILDMASQGGCFIGSAYSCVELLVYLYEHFLNVSAANLNDPGRDYFFLSKGHAVPALYAVLAEVGLLERERLANHLKLADCIYWHPHPKVPGVEYFAGSLGHLLPVAVGVALECKLSQSANRVVALTGDGELNEGSNWEACLVAAAKSLDNLTILVDRNGMQANLPTEQLIPLESLERKFQSFGCSVTQIGGHDFLDIHAAFSDLPFEAGKPNVIIADTLRGRGIQSIEGRADRWFYQPTAEQAKQWLAELRDPR